MVTQRSVKLVTNRGAQQSQEHWLFVQDTPPFPLSFRIHALHPALSIALVSACHVAVWFVL